MSFFKRKTLIPLILGILLMSSISSASSWNDCRNISDHVMSGNFRTDTNDLKYYMASSVKDYNYTEPVKEAVKSWNELSRKVNATNTSTDSNEGVIAVYIDKKAPDRKVLGRTDVFKKGWLGGVSKVDNTEDWDRARIRIFNDNMEKNNYDSTLDKYAVVTHEFGHAFSLGHSDQDLNKKNTAIMKAHYSGDNAWITEIDEYHFHYKWD